jgi:hypothetical protein
MYVCIFIWVVRNCSAYEKQLVTVGFENCSHCNLQPENHQSGFKSYSNWGLKIEKPLGLPS